MKVYNIHTDLEDVINFLKMILYALNISFAFLDGLLIGKGEKSQEDAVMTLPTSPPDTLRCVKSEYELKFSWSEPRHIAIGVTVDIYRYTLEMTGSSITDTNTPEDGFGKNMLLFIIR